MAKLDTDMTVTVRFDKERAMRDMEEYDRWYRGYQRRRRLAVLTGYGLELVGLFLLGLVAGLIFAKAWLG